VTRAAFSSGGNIVTGSVPMLFHYAYVVHSVKSNMGHSEGASGIAAVIKAVLVATERLIPANLHFTSTTHEPILSGRLRVVDSTRAFEGGLIAINNFGFGGTNAVVVGESASREVDESQEVTRFIFGRTRASVEAYFQEGDLNSAYWKKLLRSSGAVNKFPFRGVVRAKLQDEEGLELDISEVAVRPLLAFSYTGQGCQWLQMGADLWLEDDTFRTTITEACRELPIDVHALFTQGDRWLDKAWSGLGITLVQLGLTAILRGAGLRPDFIFGHSVGEVACGYADGCTSPQEAAGIAYVRCQLSEKIAAHGLMIAAGLTIDEAYATLEQFPETVVACHNSPDGVTLSGPAEDIKAITTQLQAADKFVRLVPTDGMAYHSTFFRRNRDKIKEVIAAAITKEPCQERSVRWLSTSCQDTHRLADAEYHTNNVTGMVNFCPVVGSLPAGTVVVEVGPRGLLKSVIQRCNPNVTVLGAMSLNEPGVRTVRRLLDDLWLAGVSFEFPRHKARVPLRSRVHMRWDHSADWRVASFKDFESSKKTTVSYDLGGRDSYLLDHVIDGRAIFPAAGYVYTAWQVIGGDRVHLTEIKILQAVLLTEDRISFTVAVDEDSFRVFSGSALICHGRIASYAPVVPAFKEEDIDPEHCISSEHLYRTFARRGYEYKHTFRLIKGKSLDNTQIEVLPTEHWIAYIDNILQATIINPTGIKLPTEIGSLVINCKSVANAGRRLVHIPALDVTGNAMVVVQGLKTTLSRKSHKRPVLRGIDFVYYGEHVYAHEEAYKSHLLHKMVALFKKLYEAGREVGSYAFLDKVSALCPALDGFPDTDSSYVGSLERVVDHIAGLDAKDVLDNVYLAISLAEGHDDIYCSDPSSSCGGALPGLELMVQLLRDNLGRSYSVLEVGAGSGGLTRNLYPLLQGDVSAYTASDVSVVKQYFPAINCAKYDVNLPWAGSQVDLVAASNSLHTCANISTGLKNIYSALSDDGFLLLHEYTCLLPALLWGLSDFAFSSDDTRDYALWITKDRWMTLLRSCGFEPVLWFVDEAGSQLLMLAKKVPAVQTEVKIKHRGELAAGEMQLLQTQDVGYLGMIRSLRKEPGFEGVRLSLSISEYNGSAGYVTSLAVSARKEGRLGSFHEVPLTSSSLSKRGYRAVVRTPGDLSSLRWVENPAEPNCLVRFCGVNFKDVMLSYGKLASEGDVNLGLEFSGELLQGGASVMGIATGCMATHVNCPDHLLWPVPSRISLEAAASIPVVYATVYYALVIKAGLKKGHTVLIHSVAGGVGQAAYHICRYRGAEVIATCSRDKADWVHKALDISPDRILDSHDLSFKNRVLEITAGAGVDVS
jgi:fatty acid synthase